MENYHSTLYLPLSTFNPSTETINGGGFFPQVFRKGKYSFSVVNAIQETVYLDQARLLDSYTLSFIGEERVLQQTMAADRYQQDANVEGVVAVTPYH